MYYALYGDKVIASARSISDLKSKLPDWVEDGEAVTITQTTTVVVPRTDRRWEEAK